MDRKKAQSLYIGLILLFLGMISFVYWGNQKEVWFCDEIYSYESANGFEQDWPATYTSTWMTGKDVEAFFSADGDYLSLNDISARLYNDHVPLYFWLFRMVSLYLFPGSGSIWIGLIINLLFYVVVLAVVYKIFLQLTNRPITAGVVMLFTGVVNRLMLSQLTTLRMYMMLLWEELFLVLAGLWILNNLKKKKMSPGVFLFLFVVSLCGFLTHYDFWIFYAITAAVFCMWMLISALKGKNFWHSKEFRYVLAWVGNFACSLFVTTVLFPYCKWNLNRGKGQMALQSVFVFNKEKWDHICWGYHRLSGSIFGDALPVWCGLVILFGCIFGGAYVLWRRKELQKLIGLILITLVAQGYQLVVCFTLPDAQEERYLWGAFTFMMWCGVYGGILLLQTLLAKIKEERIRKVSGMVAGGLVVICILIGQVMAIDGGNGVVYLFHPNKDVALLEEHSSEPWIVYGPTVGVYSYYDWLMPEKICFLTMERTQADVEAVKALEDKDSFVLYIYADYLSEALNFFEQELGKKFTGEYLTQSTNLTVYSIRAEQ